MHSANTLHYCNGKQNHSVLQSWDASSYKSNQISAFKVYVTRRETSKPQDEHKRSIKQANKTLSIFKKGQEL
jgi:hypothetical protein